MGPDPRKEAALKALVTQAGDDLVVAGVIRQPNHEPIKEDQDPDQDQPAGCRCFGWRHRRPASLATVVPIPEATPQINPDSNQIGPGDGAVSSSIPNVFQAIPEGQAVLVPASALEVVPAEPAQKVEETTVPEVEFGGLLGKQVGDIAGRKTLVLDLDETLVHSSFRKVEDVDIVISVELEGETHSVYVRKRPGVDEFLEAMAALFEVVVFTASVDKYANPLIDVLDPHGFVHHRLFRTACTRMPAGFVKDLSKLGRHLKDVLIIDNSPVCYLLQPANAIPIRTWRQDRSDTELLDLLPILRSLVFVESIPDILSKVTWADEHS